MADSSTIKLMVELARQGEIPLRSEWSRVAVADETITALTTRPPSTGETVDLSSFDSVSTIVIHNRSQVESEDIRVEYSYNEFLQEIDPNRIGFFPGASVDAIRPASGEVFNFDKSDYRAGARLRISGTIDANNTGAFTIENISSSGSTELQFNTNAGFGSDTAEGRGPVFEQDHLNAMSVPPGGIAIANRLYPADDIVLTSASGTPQVDIWVLGT